MDKFFVKWVDSENNSHGRFLTRDEVIKLLQEGGEYPSNYIEMISADECEE